MESLNKSPTTSEIACPEMDMAVSVVMGCSILESVAPGFGLYKTTVIIKYSDDTAIDFVYKQVLPIAYVYRNLVQTGPPRISVALTTSAYKTVYLYRDYGFCIPIVRVGG